MCASNENKNIVQLTNKALHIYIFIYLFIYLFIYINSYFEIHINTEHKSTCYYEEVLYFIVVMNVNEV